MFRVQTNMFGRYHISDAKAFYEKTSSWSVAQDPGTSVSGSTTLTAANQLLTGTTTRAKEARIEPTYMLLRLPGENTESFVLSRPFVPFSDDDSKKTLTSFMVANSDPAQYGKLTVYEMPAGFNIDGPSIVNSNINAAPDVSSRITLLNQQGSRAQWGTLLLIPVNNSIIYVRPLYVSSDNNTQIPELKQVVAVFGGEVVIRPSLREALQALFPGANPQTLENGSISQEDVNSGGANTGGTTTTTTSTTTIPTTGNATKDQLIDQAAKSLTDADTALRNGDLAGYQAKVKEAQGYLDQAQKLSDGAGATTTSTSTTAVVH
jgi:uncharacterized membrane protein (UPF0182 family)